MRAFQQSDAERLIFSNQALISWFWVVCLYSTSETFCSAVIEYVFKSSRKMRLLVLQSLQSGNGMNFHGNMLSVDFCLFPAFPITNNRKRVMAPKNLTGGDKKHFFSFICLTFLCFFNRVIVFWPSRKCKIQFRTNWSSGNFSTDLNKIMFLILLNYVLFTLTILLPGCMMESYNVVQRFTVVLIQVYLV